MVGNILRAAREESGLSLKDIEKETSIRAQYIEAIEKGERDILPSEVYVKGFIRNYATFLKLDADALVRQYNEELHGVTEEKADTAIPVAGSGREEHGPFSTGTDFKERVEESHRTQHILILLGIVIAVFVGSVYYFFGDEKTAKPDQPLPTAAKPVAPAPEPAQTPAAAPKTTTPAANPAPAASTPRTPAPSPSASAPSATGSKPSDSRPGAVSITAKFHDRCWMHVISDGQVIYEGIVDAGQTKSWKGKDRITVTAGNAGAVDIVYNGREMGRLGKEGDVVEKRYTKDKVEAGI